jgi:uncharacterized protein YbjT (DUF2867 family)
LEFASILSGDCRNYNTNMKIAIVGATGGLGQRIVQQFVKAGFEVTAVVRDEAKATSLFSGLGLTTKISVVPQINEDNLASLVDAFTGK